MNKFTRYYHKKINELKDDPAAYAKYKKDNADRARERRERLKVENPEQWEQEKKRNRERQRAYRARNPGKYHGTHREAVARWRKNNPDLYRDQHLKRAYKISLSEYNAMLKAQSYSCATCSAITPGGKGTWHVDHCHATGKVRGLLCRACNTALGLVKDNPKVLRQLASYLEKK